MENKLKNEQKYEYFPDSRDTKIKLHIFRNPLARNLCLIYFWPAATYGDFDFQDLSLKNTVILLFLKILDFEK